MSQNCGCAAHCDSTFAAHSGITTYDRVDCGSNGDHYGRDSHLVLAIFECQDGRSR
jgi:hypothetical protein